MKKHSTVAAVAASLVITMPVPAAADLKDALLGAAVGAIIQNEVSKSKRSKKATTQRERSSAPRKAAPATLNSTYTRQERVQIQTAFRDLGYPIGTIDGVLGKNSRRIIGQYQATRGEPQSGQLTRPQYVALINQASGGNAVFAARPLNRDEVRMLQQGLQNLGFYSGGIDGSQGPGTRGALNAFLGQKGVAPGQLTPVQSLILARNSAGLPTAIYLQQEAGGQFASVQPNPFGAPQQQQQLQAGFAAQQPQGQTAFGQQPQGQAVFGQQPQGQNAFAPQGQVQAGFAPQGQVQQPVNPFGQQPLQQQPVGAFGAPQQPTQGFGQTAVAPTGQQPIYPAQPQTQAPLGGTAQAPTPLFGATPQPAAPAATGVLPPANTQQQNLFAPAAPQPALPQAPAPQGGATLFAGGTQQQQPVQALVPQPTTLDIFSGSGTLQTAPQPNQLVSQ